MHYKKKFINLLFKLAVFYMFRRFKKKFNYMVYLYPGEQFLFDVNICLGLSVESDEDFIFREVLVNNYPHF